METTEGEPHNKTTDTLDASQQEQQNTGNTTDTLVGHSVGGGDTGTGDTVRGDTGGGDTGGGDTGGGDTGGGDTVETSREEKLRKYDLIGKMSAFWDPQMLLCALRWLKSKNRYPDSELHPVVETILSDTFLVQEWQTFGIQRPQEHIDKQRLETSAWDTLEAHLRRFVQCMTKVRAEVKSDPNSYIERRSYHEWGIWYQKRLLDEGEITPGTSILLPSDSGEKLLVFCRMHYQRGNIESSCKWLHFFLDYVCELTPEGLNFELRLSALWGLLACLILTLPAPTNLPPSTTVTSDTQKTSNTTTGPFVSQPQETAAEDLTLILVKVDSILEDYYDGQTVNVQLNAETDDPSAAIGGSVAGNFFTRNTGAMSPIESLNHNKQKKNELLRRRLWLLHWSVWPIFRYYLPQLLTAGRASFSRHTLWSDLLEWFFRERNIGMVLLGAPHLLRYYAVLSIINRSREDHCKLVCQTVRMASQSKRYSDPFTSLLEALFVDYDFDRAQKTLGECSVAAEADFFLAPLQPAIEESARLLIFETYCRIHKSINIDMIAERLNMTSSTAEKWIVNLIRHAKLDAKIDSERNRVEITTEPPNLYHQIVDKTRNVAMRSHILIQNLEKPGSADRGGEMDHRRRAGRGGVGGTGFGRSTAGRGRN